MPYWARASWRHISRDFCLAAMLVGKFAFSGESRYCWTPASIKPIWCATLEIAVNRKAVAMIIYYLVVEISFSEADRDRCAVFRPCQTRLHCLEIQTQGHYYACGGTRTIPR